MVKNNKGGIMSTQKDPRPPRDLGDQQSQQSNPGGYQMPPQYPPPPGYGMPPPYGAQMPQYSPYPQYPPLPPPDPNRAGLSYVSKNNEGTKSKGRDWAGILMGVILSAIVTIMLVYQITPMVLNVEKLVQDKVTGPIAQIAQIQTQMNNLIATNSQYIKAEQVDSKLSNYATKNDLQNVAKPDLSGYAKAGDAYTKTEADGKYALKGSTTTTGTGTTTTTATGEISYTIQNPQQFYSLGSSNTSYLSLRIFNNKGDSRYIRPSLTLSAWGSTSAGNLQYYPTSWGVSPTPCPSTSYSGLAVGAPLSTSATYWVWPVALQIVSGTLSQAAVTFTYVASPPPVAPSTTTNVTNVFFTPSGGGINGSGEYLLGSGQAIDLLVLVQINSSGAALWNISASGGDRAIY